MVLLIAMGMHNYLKPCINLVRIAFRGLFLIGSQSEGEYPVLFTYNKTMSVLFCFDVKRETFPL